MNDTSTVIEILSQSPIVLRHLLAQIPADRHGARPAEGKWSVKEWVCHLLDAQEILLGRFAQFETQADPLIRDYEPPPQSDGRYRRRDLAAAVAEFTNLRAHSIERLRRYDPAYWAKRGRHESFSPYGTKILLGHMLNVDYAHFFGIENAGLGKVDSREAEPPLGSKGPE